MASRPVLMTALYEQFSAFIQELQEMYPNDSDFAAFATTVKMVKSTNPALLPAFIRKHTLQFEDKILGKDEKFFLDYSFAEYENNVDLNIFSKLKQYIANMSPQSKENVWKYIQNIFRLGKALST